ncbi:Mechanosensitive ion channel protein 8 [Nosema granulosis]|uniref:Mechanosensitive ion channel protein 8 n=1 Tax=Nosema granulosis TaxID=83296 RepID=A0A9P6H3F6_9MICR|nr:Mechanosensitive ion channel protein 8 [Nosema granulosis]
MENTDFSKLSTLTYATENDTTVYDLKDELDSANAIKKKNMILLGVGLLSALLSVIFHLFVMIPIVDKADQDKNLLFVYKIIFYAMNGTYIYCAVGLVFNYSYDKYGKKGSMSFISLFIESKGRNIKLAMFFMILYFFMSTYEDILFLKNVAIVSGEDATLNSTEPIDPTGNTKKVPFDFKVFIIENFSHIFLGVSIVMLLLLIKAIIVEGLDYMMYWSHYFQKVIQTNKDIEVLSYVNSITGKKLSLRSDEWVRHVFRKLSPDGAPINILILESFFEPEKAEKIMKIFDQKGTGLVDEDHFVTTWLGITKDKKEIKNVIEYKNILLKKLDYVISVLFIPLMIFTFMSILGKSEHFKSYGSLVIGIILPLSFIFGSMVGDLFKSIIFVFFVRPFEVGDTIEVDNKVYKVDEIGLLFTSFTRQSLNVSISNNELMRKDIVNFRRSEIFEKKYTLELNLDAFKPQINLLRKHLSVLLEKNKKVFKKTFKLEEVKVKNNSTLEINLIVYANLHVHNLSENIDEFSVKLNQLVKTIKDENLRNEPNKESHNEPNTESHNEPNTESHNEPNTESQNEPNTKSQNEPNKESQNEPNKESQNELNDAKL